MASHFTALFDTCVLYPAVVRDVLLQLATTGLFRAKWSDEILQELIASLEQRGISRSTAEAMTALMNRAVPDCLVRGFEPLVESLSLPDKNDRHVLAAAIVARADVIITFNLTDFPETDLEPYGLESQHPDEFVAHLIDLHPAVVVQSLRIVRQRWKRPAFTAQGFLEVLRSRELARAADLLSPHLESL